LGSLKVLGFSVFFSHFTGKLPFSVVSAQKQEISNKFNGESVVLSVAFDKKE